MRHLSGLTVLALASALGACSPAADAPNSTPPAADAAVSPVPAPAAAPTPASADVIGMAGLGDLRIGEPPPTGGGWAVRGAQIGDGCRTLSSPDYPGVYAIVTDGKVRRITVGQRSDVRLAEGLGVGASEQDVRQAFPGFRETPHKYEAAPAKYLTAPNAESGDPALRFEIGSDGKVKLIHVGTMPELGYVEGCA